MKTALILFTLFTMISTFSNTKLEIYCYNSYQDKSYNLLDEHDPHCLGNLVWAQNGVCFRGDATFIANLINEGLLSSKRYGLINEDAEVIDKDTISYFGTDQKNFWGPSQRELKRCVQN